MTSLSSHLEIRKVASSHHDLLALKLRVTLVADCLANVPVKFPPKYQY